MIARDRNGGFAARPRDVESWIKSPDPSLSANSAADLYTARLTADITPALRGRIKIAAFQRGITVADMLRDLLAREFPDTDGDRP
ncbi:MAG: hypothetical protein BGO00_06805 [Alphaproteobacteria bacterium 62-8]|nr:MAG: hypothetical protein BGO00_06805 [Alphaproteobacteria bacterium 62-8]